MRELPPPDELLKERDGASIIQLPNEGWYCEFCPPLEDDYLGTVEWIAGPDNGRPYGRCFVCGQKYVTDEPEWRDDA